ncbi:MAG: SWIM zinc finger family protein [Holophaga sp.]|nr:SWIM zinc finger family protein [Holophaga sp.]
MPRLSTEQVKALAPDPASLKAGTTLTDIRYWSNLGSDQMALWGECQGSGREPYIVCVDLADNDTRCTCPSRKFPCKHALGLMLVAAGSPARLPEAKPPAWAAEWIGKRTERRQTELRPAEPVEASPVQPERKKETERRASKRIKLAETGIEALEQWLKDFARLGLAAAQSAPASFWADQAARMVDAQLPGAARLITEMSMLPGSRPDWAEVLLLQLGRLYLLTQAFRKLDAFPFPEQQDILTLLGWTVNQRAASRHDRDPG